MSVFETQRLSLQEVERTDASFIFELLNTPTWIKNIGTRGIKTLEDAENYIEKAFVKSYQENGLGLYKMVLKKTGESIGICGLVNRPTLPHVDIGFAILPAFERQGYTYEAAQATMEFAKSTLGLTTLLGITTEENTASRRLLEKIGLRYVKTEKSGDEELMVYSRVFST